MTSKKVGKTKKKSFLYSFSNASRYLNLSSVFILRHRWAQWARAFF